MTTESRKVSDDSLVPRWAWKNNLAGPGLNGM
jgi:hypothetical protein